MLAPLGVGVRVAVHSACGLWHRQPGCLGPSFPQTPMALDGPSPHYLAKHLAFNSGSEAADSQGICPECSVMK